jgi:hypothetical protein
MNFEFDRIDSQKHNQERINGKTIGNLIYFSNSIV